MKTKTRKIWVWILIGAAILCLCVAAVGAGAGWWLNRNAGQAKPVVWIGNPRHHQVYTAGENIPVRAYVRSTDPVKKMELWVDMQLVETVTADANGVFPSTGLSYLAQGWDEGAHTLVAKAVTGKGGEGQATIRVDVAGIAPDTSVHVVTEGETIESIAEDYGVPAKELAESNPGAAGGEVSAGDQIEVPGGDPTDPPQTPDEGTAADMEELPVDYPDPIPPVEAASDNFLHVFGFNFEGLAQSQPAESLPLRIEVLHLVTQDPYDSLHCYIGTTGSLPRWYPDSDSDQATDESFVNTPGWGWNIGDYLAGDHAPTIQWPGNEDLAIDINCTGVINAGTEAVNAGRMTLSIPSVLWDGMPRWATSLSEEGTFDLQYQVSTVEERPRGFPIELDITMTPPSNLRLEDDILRWDYIPTPDDEPIDGFLLYFHGNVIWNVAADSRSFNLPDEWLNPVCGTSYEFTVGSVIGDYPASRESPQSNSVTIEPQPDSCNRQVMVTFLSIETHQMDRDGNFEDRSGEIGPPFGTFAVNDQTITFDTGSLGYGLDYADGWSSNTVYDLVDMAARDRWNFSGPPNAVVEIGEGGTFDYTFEIWDEDSGRCDDDDDPGCDDLICRGGSMILEGDIALAELDTAHDQTILSDDHRCSLTVRIEPTGEGATGTASGDLPYPLIWLQDITYDEDGNNANITYVNQGRAAWPNTDLEINLLTREGDLIRSLTRENYNLAAGGVDTLTESLEDGELDVCVAFDPNNLVTEMGELYGTISEYRPFCMPQPDLLVESISYNRESANLEVNVRNAGGGEILNRTLQLSIAMSGIRETLDLDVPGFSLGENSATTVNFPLSVPNRNQMRGVNSEDGIGYMLTVNLAHSIAESDYDNNSYAVAEARNFSVGWLRGCSDAVLHAANNHFITSFTGTITGETLFDWDSPEHSVYYAIGDPNDVYECWSTGSASYHEQTQPFSLMGDETLLMQVTNRVTSGAEAYNLGWWNATVDPNDPLDYTDTENAYYCQGATAENIGDGTYYPGVDYPGEDDGRPDPGSWFSVVHVCRLRE